jgi:hypothetical protein
MEEEFVKVSGRLFEGDLVGEAMAQTRKRIERQVDAATDDELLEADADAWAAGFAAEEAIDPPVVDTARSTLKALGRVKVDCTNAAGISYTLTEYGHVIRDGFAFELRVPVSGHSTMLDTAILGVARLPAQLSGDDIVCRWDWPEEKGTEAFEREVESFKNELSRGVDELRAKIEEANRRMPGFVIEAIEARRSEILAERDFLGELSIPVVRDNEEPAPFDAPPPIKRLETPAGRIKAADAEPPERELQPQLDEFYDHILTIIRAVGRGLERSPGSFANADEEALRDQMLVTLNTHYRGATYAEAFNGNGKTDILIRVYDRNAFIGECKWWSGPKALEEALDQLFGYTTWQDSRVALIFYVPTKDITATIEKAKEALGARDEFVEWQEAGHEGEVRGRVRWPEDPERTATLTSVFVHLPKGE